MAYQIVCLYREIAVVGFLEFNPRFEFLWWVANRVEDPYMDSLTFLIRPRHIEGLNE